jgi:tetratricopeptide (TPR) repeat protein
VKSTHRHTAVAVGTLALSLVGAPLFAQAAQQQRGGAPNQDTPYILIAAFHSSDRKLGSDMADELRKRIAGERSAKELYVIPKQNVNATLEASGYKPDSALNSSDLMELAKQLRGEQVIDGTINKSPNGVHVETRVLMRTGQQTVAQPLPAFDAKDAGDAAAKIERALSDAAKSFPAYKTCTNDLRAAKYDDAVTHARAGLAAYSNSSLARLCILTAFAQQKAPADSIISVANALRTIDPTNMIALANLGDAYLAKGDTAGSIQTRIAMSRADPSNTTLIPGIINDLVNSGAPDKALPLIDTLLINNPGDPQMLRTKWLLQLRAKQFKQALATGEELVKADTAAANVDFFSRQIGAAQADSNSAAVTQLAERASHRFPNDPSFSLLLAQGYLKAGQLQQALAAARRASDASPKDTRPWLFMLAVQNQMNQPDSLIATAQKAIAAGVPKDSLSASLLAVAGPALKKAQDSKDRADWETALKAAQTVDAVTPSPQTKFYVGVSAFYIGQDAINNVQKLYKSSKKDDKEKACVEAKAAEDAFATASTSMPAGGKVDPAAAGQIMGALGQYGEFLTQVKTALKCK